MSTFAQAPISEPIEDGLILRSCATKEDIERVAEMSGIIHGAEVTAMTNNLFHHHPSTDPQDLIFVENESGEVVSTVCLIPWRWHYAGIDLPVAELGIVGTVESYRNRGLVRAQVVHFRRRLHGRGCLISSIQGIPGYYRQYGYEYAIPLEGGWRLELRHVPESGDEPFTIREATPQDLQSLMDWYAQMTAKLQIHAVRDEAIWRYLLAEGMATDAMVHDTLVVEDSLGNGLGYVRLPGQHFGAELAIDEASDLPVPAMLAVLQHAKALAQERQKPGIRLNLPKTSSLVRLAKALGAHDMGTYAWQIHLPDIPNLLRILAPVLEMRMADSPFAGLTQEVRLNFYCNELALHFQEGKLSRVSDWQKPAGAAQISLPPAAFVPLVMGYRNLDELRSIYADVGVHGYWRLLAEVLFPTVPSFIHTIY